MRASEDDLKGIVADASREGQPEGAFHQDLRYEFHRAKHGHARDAAGLILDHSERIDDGSVRDFAAMIEVYGNRFIDALLPRYAIAAQANPDERERLRSEWFRTLDNYLKSAASEYDGFAWMDGGEGLRDALRSIEIRFILRIDHGIRGIVIEPKPEQKWHERHPVAYAVGLVVLGALLAGLVDAVVKAVTGG